MGFESSEVAIKCGDIVTISYENSSRSFVPINPVITRVRFDMTWKDAVHNHRITQLNGMIYPRHVQYIYLISQ